MRTLGPGRERSSCLKGRRGTWLGRSSRPPGRSSEAGRLRSASAAACALRQARQARPRRAAERRTRAAMAEAAPARVSARPADALTGRGRGGRRRRREGLRPAGVERPRRAASWLAASARAGACRVAPARSAPPPRAGVRAGLSGRPTGRPKRQAGRRGGPDGGGQAGLPSNTSDDRPCLATEWLFPRPPSIVWLEARREDRVAKPHAVLTSGESEAQGRDRPKVTHLVEAVARRLGQNFGITRPTPQRYPGFF